MADNNIQDLGTAINSGNVDTRSPLGQRFLPWLQYNAKGNFITLRLRAMMQFLDRRCKASTLAFMTLHFPVHSYAWRRQSIRSQSNKAVYRQAISELIWKGSDVSFSVRRTFEDGQTFLSGVGFTGFLRTEGKTKAYLELPSRRDRAEFRLKWAQEKLKEVKTRSQQVESDELQNATRSKSTWVTPTCLKRKVGEEEAKNYMEACEEKGEGWVRPSKMLKCNMYHFVEEEAETTTKTSYRLDKIGFDGDDVGGHDDDDDHHQDDDDDPAKQKQALVTLVSRDGNKGDTSSSTKKGKAKGGNGENEKKPKKETLQMPYIIIHVQFPVIMSNWIRTCCFAGVTLAKATKWPPSANT
eukprot:2428659-Amphidinium_carterae.3